MSLSKSESAELRRLAVEVLDEEGNPNPKAKTKDMARWQQLIAMAQEPDTPDVPKLKGHKLSVKGQELKERGATYIGCENVNFGTDEKPRYVVRESRATSRRPVPAVRPQVLVTMGGGEDGADNLDTYLDPDARAAKAQRGAELEPTGHVAKRIREAEAVKKPDLAISMLKHAQAKQIPASYLLVDSWFASPKFFKDARGCDLHTVARLKNNKTRYLHTNKWLRLAQLYDARKDTLVKDKKLGCLLSSARTQCRNGVEGHIVFVKGYKEPEIDTIAGRKKSKQPKWIAIFCTDLKLSAHEVVKKYILRWSIEVFFKEAKQRLGLGKEQSRSFAAQLFSTTQAFVRYSILAYLLEQQPSHRTIGDMFHQIEQESGTLNFFERLWDYFCLFLRRCLDTLAQFLDFGPEFRNYIGAICSAVNAFEPLKGCET